MSLLRRLVERSITSLLRPNKRTVGVGENSNERKSTHAISFQLKKRNQTNYFKNFAAKNFYKKSKCRILLAMGKAGQRVFRQWNTWKGKQKVKWRWNEQKDLKEGYEKKISHWLCQLVLSLFSIFCSCTLHPVMTCHLPCGIKRICLILLWFLFIVKSLKVLMKHYSILTFVTAFGDAFCWSR